MVADLSRAEEAAQEFEGGIGLAVDVADEAQVDEMARAVIEKSQLEHATEQRARARQRLDGQEDVDRLRRAVVNMPVLRQNLGRRASR